MTLSRTIRVKLLHDWMRRYVYVFIALFALFCYLIKGIPMAPAFVVGFILASFLHFFWRYEKKREQLDLK